MKAGSLPLRLVMSLSALAAVFLVATPAFAKTHKVYGAPEIDPAGLMAVGTLLVGGLAVARGRRRSV